MAGQGDLDGRAADEAESQDGSAPEGLGRTVIGGVELAGAGYLLSQALTFVSYLVLAKLATPRDFGHFAAATLLVGIGTVLAESGMLAALIQRRDRVEEAFNTAFVATLTGGVLLSLLALAVAPLIGLYFHSTQTGIVAAAMSGSMLLRMATIVPDARMQREFSFFRRVIVDPLAALAFAVGAIVAAAEHMGVWALVIGTYASSTAQVLASWLLTSWKPHLRSASISLWRELAQFGRPVVLSEIVRRVTSELPTLALGRFAGAAPLGQYSYASRVATRPAAAVTDVGSYVLLPAFARLSAHDDRYRPAVLRSLRWSCTISFPAGLLLIPLGHPAVVLVFGHHWSTAGYGAMALGVFCAASSLQSLASEVWKASARTDMLPRMHGLSLVLTLVFVSALVPFGVVGVCAALSVRMLAVAAYAVRGTAHVVGLPSSRLVAEIWPPALAAVVMAAIIYVLERSFIDAAGHPTLEGLALLVVEVLIAALTYLLSLSVVSRATVRELVHGGQRSIKRMLATNVRA